MIDLPHSSNPPLTRDEYTPEAYRAIGRFVVAYADAEKGLAMTLDRFVQRRFFKRSYSHEGVQVLAALFGGLRMDKLRQLSRDLAARTGCGTEDIEIIEGASVQLQKLQEFRNRIGHYGAFPMQAGDEWHIQTSNKYNVKDYQKREIWRYSVGDLDSASKDMQRCVFRISHALFPEDREVLQKNAINYHPLEDFEFDMTQVRREPMPLTKR